MRAARIALTVVATAMLCVGAARAQSSGPVQALQPHPGAAALAAACNIVFMPVRVALAAVGAELGGITGWLTAGNANAAEDVWHLPPFDGQMYLQREMMYGEEPLDFGEYSYRMHVTPE
jgi:hypothetical protein